MRIERLQVSNHERWGKLVKTWATGTNYLEDDDTYPLPPFYKRLFNGIDPVIPEQDKFKVHAERIGDYTLSLCA